MNMVISALVSLAATSKQSTGCCHDDIIGKDTEDFCLILFLSIQQPTSIEMNFFVAGEKEDSTLGNRNDTMHTTLLLLCMLSSMSS